VELGGAAVGNLARIICGDAPYTMFPYRSSSYLTAFFEGLNLNHAHDGSTRYWWVRSILVELNSQPSSDDRMPNSIMTRIIEYVLHPDHFVNARDKDQSACIERMREVLRPYELDLDVDAQKRVRLVPCGGEFVSTAVDVRVARRTITFTPLVFSVPETSLSETQVSVMMPFAAEFDATYNAIKEACQRVNLSCYRADDIWVNSTFIQDIFDLIFASRLVVVDFTGRNSNVMYETGIAHTLGKVVVPITQSLDDIPSDLKPHRALKYLPNREGLEELSKRLELRLRTLITPGPGETDEDA
jgi:hypothetical protein